MIETFFSSPYQLAFSKSNQTTKLPHLHNLTVAKLKMAVCKVCSQPLVVELDADSFDEATSSSVGTATTAPDDLLLACGCHFHWYVAVQFS